jgi:hypothetical protein
LIGAHIEVHEINAGARGIFVRIVCRRRVERNDLALELMAQCERRA